MNIYTKDKKPELQIEFDFMDENREEEKKPKGELKYFSNPKNDNEKMFNLQKDFYDGREEAYWELWLIAEKVAETLIKKCQRSGGYQYNEDELEDKKLVAVEYVLRRLKYDKGYIITTNWITAIKGGVKHALEHQTKAEKIVDFVPLEDMKNITMPESDTDDDLSCFYRS